MAHLSDQDSASIKELRAKGVLTEVWKCRLPIEGIIIVTCADGDQMADLFAFQQELMVKQGLVPRIHTFGLNGGALLLAPNSPVTSKLAEDKVLLDQIETGAKLKKMNSVILYAHAPCGAAALAHLSVKDELHLLFTAAERVKKECSSIKAVTCFFHVATNSKKRTYLALPETR